MKTVIFAHPWNGSFNKAILDKVVEKYQEILKNTDELILVFPIWWMLMPAVLKGFFDKVMVKGFAYENTQLLI